MKKANSNLNTNVMHTSIFCLCCCQESAEFQLRAFAAESASSVHDVSTDAVSLQTFRSGPPDIRSNGS